jgi:nucleoside transporter
MYYFFANSRSGFAGFKGITVTRSLKIRLAAVMFLQFFIAGAFVPVLSLYLINYLHFSGRQAGIIFSLTSAGSVVAPLFTMYIADRFIRSERLLALCHGAGGAIMFAFAAQTAFVPAALLYLAFTLVNTPTFALTNAIIFHHSPGTRQRFGSIRVWGTIGWIAVAWLFSFLWLRHGGSDLAGTRLPDALKLAGAASMVLCVFAFLLPAPRRHAAGLSAFFPRQVLRVFRHPRVIVFCAFMFLITMVDRFYYFGTSPFLHFVGFSDKDIMPLMSLGQIPEVFGMFLLGWLLRGSGSKKVMLLGIGFDLFRYTACAAGGPHALVISGLIVHGLAYTFIYTTAAIHFDGFCDSDSRTGAHQLFSLFTAGIGNCTGSLLVGASLDWCRSSGGSIAYRSFWLVPTFGIATLFAAMLILISAPPRRTEKNAALPEHEVNL